MRLPTLLLLVLLGLGLLVWALSSAGSRARRAPEPADTREPLSSLPTREVPLELLPPAAESVREVLPAVPAAPVPASVPETVRVVVSVLQALDRRPLADVEVTLHAGPAARVEQRTNRDGCASFELGADTWRMGSPCQARVVQSGTQALFDGSVPLAPAIVLLASNCTRLHGEIAFEGPVPLELIGVSAFEPARGAMSTSVLLAEGRVTAAGKFELLACPSRSLPLVRLQIAAGTIAVYRDVAWSELASEPGARIRLAFGELLVHVSDPAGRPVGEAEVRAAPRRDGGGYPSVLMTSTRGEVRLQLPGGACALCVGKPGYSSLVDEIELVPSAEPQRLDLVLAPLDARQVLEGRVIHDDGTPVDKALVTATPTADVAELGLAGVAQARTGADGSFRLPIASAGELVVVAFERTLGLSDELRFRPDGRRLLIVIRPQGGLEVELDPPPGLGAVSGGRVEYVLVDRKLERTLAGHEFALPFRIEEVPEGDYNLFVLVQGWDALATGSVSIAAGRRAGARLQSQQASWARGHVRTGDRRPVAGVTLRLEHSGWPEEVERTWSVTTAPDGAFELLLPAPSGAGVQVLEAGLARARARVGQGDGFELVVP